MSRGYQTVIMSVTDIWQCFRAEEESKLRQEKTMEIRQLVQQIQFLNADITRQEEILKECTQYKSFLDSLKARDPSLTFSYVQQYCPWL